MNNTTNRTIWTTDEDPYNDYRQPEYFKIAAYCVVIVLSLVGNSLVVAVVFKNENQRMRTPNNYFVVSMAVSDGLITIVNMVSQVAFLLYDSGFPFGGIVGIVFCKFQNFMWMFLVSWSTGSLSAIAVDRFLLVFFPLKRIITIRTARVVIAGIIIVGAAVSCPNLAFSTIVEYDDVIYCYVNISNFELYRVYILFIFSIFIFFPFAILLILYSAIALKLWRRRSPGNQQNRETMNRRIVPLLITIVLIFLLCWMPIASSYFSCIAEFNLDSTTCRALVNEDSNFALWFVAYSNSAINPYIYFIFNENFRHGARVIWSSIRGCRTFLSHRHNQVDADVELRPTEIH